MVVIVSDSSLALLMQPFGKATSNIWLVATFQSLRRLLQLMTIIESFCWNCPASPWQPIGRNFSMQPDSWDGCRHTLEQHAQQAKWLPQGCHSTVGHCGGVLPRTLPVLANQRHHLCHPSNETIHGEAACQFAWWPLPDLLNFSTGLGSPVCMGMEHQLLHSGNIFFPFVLLCGCCTCHCFPKLRALLCQRKCSQLFWLPWQWLGSWAP